MALTERQSHYSLLGNVAHRTAPLVEHQVVALLSPFAAQVRTLISDNGKEFAGHQLIAKALNLKFYFAHPYAAWERGTNEKPNGLLRQYFPKRQDFRTTSNKQIQQAMLKLNSQPRKCLRYQTPFEVLYKSSVALTS